MIVSYAPKLYSSYTAPTVSCLVGLFSPKSYHFPRAYEVLYTAKNREQEHDIGVCVDIYAHAYKYTYTCVHPYIHTQESLLPLRTVDKPLAGSIVTQGMSGLQTLYARAEMDLSPPRASMD